MNIALFGGAFNPPHIGHILIARQVLDFTDADQVWFLPNYGQDPPKDVALVQDRLAMTRCISESGMKVSTIEIEHALDGNTINLLPYLPSEHTYTFVIGSDQLAAFHTWKNHKDLLQQMPFVVFPRFGYATKPLYNGMTLLEHDILITTDISSTKIRKRVSSGLSISHFVLPAVEGYIQEKGLYRE